MASFLVTMNERQNRTRRTKQLMRRFLLWLILTAFLSGMALEAAPPAWTPVPGRKHATSRKIRKAKRRHQRKKRKKRRQHRRIRRAPAAARH